MLPFRGSSDEETRMEQEPFIPKEECTAGSSLKGYSLTVLIAIINLAELLATGQISAHSTIPGYTQNFARSIIGVFVIGLASILHRESLDIRGAIVTCLQFGTASWFFQWGYTKCLISLSQLQYTAANVSVGPVIGVILGFALLGEMIGLYKTLVMVRNVVVVFFILYADGSGARSASILGDSTSIIPGFLWALVAFCGTAGMRIVQRTSLNMTPAKLAFWGYLMNVVLWFPPGCGKVRMSFLWPVVPQDKNDIFTVPATTWMTLVISGVFGTSIIIIQGWVLKYLDVGTYSITIAPLILFSSTIYDIFEHGTGLCMLLGLAIAGLGFAYDMYLESSLPKSN